MSKHANAALVERFYSAFQKIDAEAMVACYHDDVAFSDPVFPALRGERAKGMWRMLCAQSTDLRLTFDGVEADDERGSARWEARYTFSKTGRPVHNIIEARFRFADGLIVEHQDSFNLRRWAAMALGAKGVLFGWLPPVQNAIRGQAASALDHYMAKRGAAPPS
ncbi:MAG: nuclear transport factor 2 family protein [Myxococcales bacterium]|nr:nuclear transport factor 2 family protein [Myxococcales bacterium]